MHHEVDSMMGWGQLHPISNKIQQKHWPRNERDQGPNGQESSLLDFIYIIGAKAVLFPLTLDNVQCLRGAYVGCMPILCIELDVASLEV